MLPSETIYVAGHMGLVGSAILRCLKAEGYRGLITVPRDQLDLRDRAQVDHFFEFHKPDHVFMAAARVGGILANQTFPADFILDNLLVQTNVIDAAHRFGTKKLLFLGSSCIYPRMAQQPIHESQLGIGPLEPTNEAYAWAKLAGIAMVQAYRRQHGFDGISVMPTNLYGPGDNFKPVSSHLVAGLMTRMHQAKLAGEPRFFVWGSGQPRRELLHVDDLARACVVLMQSYSAIDIVNVGTGVDQTIAEIARAVARAVGYTGELAFDTSKPDGMPRKVLDISRLRSLTTWEPKVWLAEGLAETYAWYLANVKPSWMLT